jgi:hypothetical protein
MVISNTGVIPIHYKLPLGFVFVFIGRGSMGYKKLFQAYLNGGGGG